MKAHLSRRVVCLPLLVVAACGGGGARPRVDQAQAEIDLDAPYNLNVGDTSQQRLAQVVTAGVSGDLVGFRMPVACASGWLDYSVQGVLPSGLPDGVAAAEGRMHAADLATFHDDLGSYPLLAFDDPPSFRAGATFALVISSDSPCGLRPGPVGDPYARGDGAYHALPDAFWVLLGNPRFDLPFETLVR